MVSEFLNVQLPIDEYDTLSGFIIGELGRIPNKGDDLTLEYNNLIFKVKELDDKRIAKVKVCVEL